MTLGEINVEEFINSLNDFSNNKLNNIEDLKRILEIVKNNNLFSVLENVLFSAKAFNGLMRIIKNSDNKFDNNYFEKLRNEIKYHTEIMIGGLKEISLKGGSFINEILTEKYFQLTTESLSNLSLLASDLEYVKLYFNDNK